MSSLTWLDFSEAERRRALQIVELFALRETRDELGLGSIRDALANTMFPGVSTVQRRARYFLFVPWIFRAAEIRTGDRLHRTRKDELGLIGTLSDGNETDGIIGSRAGERLNQLPSMIYWQGLERWGIRRRRGTREQWANSRNSPTANDDGERVGALDWWHDNLLDAPHGFPGQASLALRPEEAEYLSERIISSCPGSLLGWIVGRRQTWDPTDFAWDLPMREQLSAAHRRLLGHAQHFSQAMNGAALLYNLMLAEATENSDLRDTYETDLKAWGWLSSEGWDLTDFWTLTAEIDSRHSAATRRFVDAWVVLMRSGADPGTSAARELVRSREFDVKRRYARLSYDSARDTWRGAAGAGQLNFRWPSAQRQLLDIVRELETAA